MPCIPRSFPQANNIKLTSFSQTQQMQIKLKFKGEVKRFFFLLTCQVFKVQGSVFLFQHLTAETPKVEWRDFLLTVALFIISKVSTNVFNTMQHTQTDSPCPSGCTVWGCYLCSALVYHHKFQQGARWAQSSFHQQFSIAFNWSWLSPSQRFRISYCRRKKSS